MDYLYFYNLYKKSFDNEYPERCLELSVLRKFLDGTAYNVLTYPFVCTYNNVGQTESGPQYEKIPMSMRRPSVITTLCGTVVDDSVSFLFGEGRFPQVLFQDEGTQKIMDELIQKSQLPAAMVNLATEGSVGSGALLIKLLNGHIFYESLKTEYLTPVFDRNDPNKLVKLTQKYKVLGSDLRAEGYDIDNPNIEYWFQRDWTEEQEIYYLPWRKSSNKENEKTKAPTEAKVDKSRTFSHNLGFVPVVWVRNLMGGDFVDGKCTFKKGITTNIQLDYQLSQAGRGLTYSQEPLLFYKNPNVLSDGSISIGDGTVLVGGENSDAKMIETNGEGLKAAIAYQQMLRQIVLENIHGNRSVPDRMTSHAASGKALEMLHYPLILLASRLRFTYGEVGLVNVLKMLLKIIKTKEVLIDDMRIDSKSINDKAIIDLQWPDWFDMTYQDKQLQSVTLAELVNTGLMSQETAVKTLAPEYGIWNVPEEIDLINQEREQFIQEAAPKIQETFKS